MSEHKWSGHGQKASQHRMLTHGEDGTELARMPKKGNWPGVVRELMYMSKGALLVVGAAPAIAKGTASIEPAGRAKTATAAMPKAYGRVGDR